MSEINVSPIDGDNALLVNGFRIELAAVTLVRGAELTYFVYRKGLHINTYTNLQEAVEWCSD